MKKIKLLVYLLILSLLFSCEQPTEKRKIKLANNNSRRQSSEQSTTTLRLVSREQRSVAVMFFQNKTGDENLQWLQKGLAEMLIRSLSQSHSLSILTTDRLFEVLKRLEMIESPREINMEMAAVVAKEANVETVITGNISRIGDSLQISVKLHEPGQGMVFTEQQVEGVGLEKILVMVDQLARKVKGDLQIELEKQEKSRGIAELSTHSLKAWQRYTAGIEKMSQLHYAEAAKELELALELDSTFVAAYLRLGSAYFSLGKQKQAIEIAKVLKNLKSKASAQEQFQIARFQAGIDNDLQKIVALNREWLEKFPEDRDANLGVAGFNFNLHDYEQAIHYYRRVLEIDPKYSLAYNQLGYAYAYIGDFKNALAILEKYREINPDQPNPYDSLGEIYSFLGDYRQAESNFQQAIRKHKDFIASRENLADLKLDQGQYKQSLELFKTYFQQAPDGQYKTRALACLGLTNWRLGKYENAIRNYRQALQENNNSIVLIERIIEIYQEMGDSTGANQFLKQNYQSFKKRVLQNNQPLFTLTGLAVLSLTHDLNTEETISLLEKAITGVKNKTLELQVKFLLTLLYLKTDKIEAINSLWEGQESLQLMTFLRVVRNLSYTGIWKNYFLINRLYYKEVEAGIQNYNILIDYAVEHQLKMVEMIFRIFLADVYRHQGDVVNTENQLKMAGVPPEQTWLLIGPFENRNGFLKKFPPEKKIELNKVCQFEDRNYAWQSANDGQADGFINLKHHFQRPNWSVAYGLIDLKSPGERSVQLRVGSNEALKVWLNDEEVWKFNAVRQAILDDNVIPVRLKTGRNRILVKVCNRVGEWGFYLRVTDQTGNGIPELIFENPQQAKGSGQQAQISRPKYRTSELVAFPTDY